MNGSGEMQPRSNEENEGRRKEDRKGEDEPGYFDVYPTIFTGRAGKEVELLAYKVIGVAIEVHRLLGPGFLEAVYETALCHEMELRGIPHQRQAGVPVRYKGVVVGEGKVDLLVGGLLIVELKACEMLTKTHKAQAISYLRATDLELALLINFNVELLREGIKRVLLTR